MTSKRKSALLLGLLLTAGFAGGGCGGGAALLTPIPVPAWVPDYIAERAQNKNDHRTVVMPPIPPGVTPQCEDPPDKASILRTMPRVARGVPFIYEEFRDAIETTSEKLVDHMDPPRFYPLIGPAQLHHCHWKCTIYYTETIVSSWPLPYQVKRRRTEVVYIDQDHLHLFIVGQEFQRDMARDMMGARP